MNDDYVPPAFRPSSEQPPRQAPPPPPPMNPISRIEFERVFGGRVLAWIGGLATLLGVIFLMRSAVDSSWFTEEVRVLMAAFGSLLLLGLGLWLLEMKGRLEVARRARRDRRRRAGGGGRGDRATRRSATPRACAPP